MGNLETFLLGLALGRVDFYVIDQVGDRAFDKLVAAWHRHARALGWRVTRVTEFDAYEWRRLDIGAEVR